MFQPGPNDALKPKFYEAETFGGWEKRGQTNRQTRFMFYKYRFAWDMRSLVNGVIFESLYFEC